MRCYQHASRPEGPCAFCCKISAFLGKRHTESKTLAMQPLTKTQRNSFHAKGRCAAITKHSAKAEAEIEKLSDVIQDNRKPVIGTLSFPVCRPEGRALRDNRDIIVAIIRRRQPDLLLCAGWLVAAKRSLASIKKATQMSKTVVILETSGLKKVKTVSWRIENGRSFRMGEQVIKNSKDTTASCLTCLTSDLANRKFRFCGRMTILLICGEVTIVKGRNKGVTFRRDSATPLALKSAVRGERVLILNPTHTRMGNAGTLKAWRSFLSQSGRVYVSASNWDVGSKRAQRPSKTLHELWHDAKCKKPSFCSVPQYSFSYREWVLPQ